MTELIDRTLHEKLIAEIRDALTEQKITQKDLAAAMGMTEKHMSLVLSGRRRGSLSFFDSAGRQLGLHWLIVAVDLRPNPEGPKFIDRAIDRLIESSRESTEESP